MDVIRGQPAIGPTKGFGKSRLIGFGFADFDLALTLTLFTGLIIFKSFFSVVSVISVIAVTSGVFSAGGNGNGLVTELIFPKYC